MIEKRTVFVLGAGASCPYGFPSGAQLRTEVCLSLQDVYRKYCRDNKDSKQVREYDVNGFIKTFFESGIKSIDVFMATNPKSAATAKYVISFEIFTAEQRSEFRERAMVAREAWSRAAIADSSPGKRLVQNGYFRGDDWYSYLFNRLIEGLLARDALPDFSDGRVAFITFNYDRSLEYFLYESVRNSFREVSEDRVVECLKNLRILHVYGQVAPLKWQDPNEGVDYRPQITESLLRSAANNIKTIYEEKESPELVEAHKLIESAHRIIFLGFGYRPENMDVLNLPDLIRGGCEVRGTAFNMIEEDVKRVLDTVTLRRRGDGSSYCGSYNTRIEPCDCLMLLRKYL